jgi:hypothetical protein
MKYRLSSVDKEAPSCPFNCDHAVVGRFLHAVRGMGVVPQGFEVSESRSAYSCTPTHSSGTFGVLGTMHVALLLRF